MNIEVQLNPSGTGGKILIDGKDVSSAVTEFRIEAVVGKPTKVYLELINVSVHVVGTATPAGSWMEVLALAQSIYGSMKK